MRFFGDRPTESLPPTTQTAPKSQLSVIIALYKVPRKMLTNHQERCDQRPVDCEYCGATLHQGSMAAHFNTCINYPVNCTLCHNNIARSQLAEHQASLCPGRTVTCDRCLESTTAGELQTHKESCRFMQTIILPAYGENPAAVLVPQPDARGPFYQEDSPTADTSTIYMAMPQKRFLQSIQEGIHRRSHISHH